MADRLMASAVVVTLGAASIDNFKGRYRATAANGAGMCAETCKSITLAMRQQRSKTYVG